MRVLKNSLWTACAVFTAVFLMLLFLVTPSQAEGEDGIAAGPRVLYLSSYSYEWESVPIRLDTVRGMFDGKATVNYVFMDTKRKTYDETKEGTYADIFEREKESGDYDYIIAADDDALTFVLEYRDSLFAGTPVVFDGINNVSLAREAAQDPNSTGIVEAFPLQETIELATGLNPTATRVVGITDETVSGLGSTSQFMSCADAFPNLSFSTLDCSSLTLEEIADVVQGYGSDTIPVFLMMTTDAQGNHFTGTEAVKFLSSRCSVPIYKADEIGIGQGLLGGVAVSYESAARNSAQIVLDLINGAEISSFSLQEAPVSCVLDKTVMDKFGITKSQIERVEGENVTYLNDEPTLLDSYGVVLVPLGIVIIVLLVVLIVVYLMSRRRKRHLEEISDRDVMLSSLLDNLPGGVVVYRFDKKSFIPDFYSEGMVKLTGRSMEDYRAGIARDAANMFNGEGTASLVEEVTEKALSKQPISTRYRLKRADGSLVWVSFSAVYMRTDRETYIYYAIFSDISASMLAHERELEAQAASAANEAKTRFLSTVSHDMRTPLNGVLGITELMLEKVDDEDLRRDLLLLDNSGQYLLNLINDTLDVSKIESGKLELHPSVCDGKGVLENALALLQGNIDSKHIRLITDIRGLSFTQLYIDYGRVQQVLVNLIGNAVKFTPEGGTVTFTMRNLAKKDGVITDEIIVEDTGIGMSKDFMPHLFEAFAQESQDGNTSNNGTGLGMSISRSIIELMGGTITVESEKGKGTVATFTINLPIASPEQIEKAHAVKKRFALKGGFAGKRLLIVEDNEVNTLIAQRLLEGKGAIAESATNGKAGVERFEASAAGYFSAILMDVRMPIMDGLEAARRIRASSHPQAKTIPIIAMTANAFDEDIEATKKAGMTAHLSKPINAQVFFEVLMEQMGEE